MHLLRAAQDTPLMQDTYLTVPEKLEQDRPGSAERFAQKQARRCGSMGMTMQDLKEGAAPLRRLRVNSRSSRNL